MADRKLQEDFLKELANIGIGHAATALNQMINDKVEITLPKMCFVSIDDIHGADQQHFSGITAHIRGDAEGALVTLFADESSFWVIDKISGNTPGTTSAYDDMGKSTIKEFYNIIGGAFLSALANMMALRLMPEIPELVIGDLTSIQQQITQITNDSTQILSVETELRIEGKDIQGAIYLILTPDSFAKISSQMLG